MITTFYILVLIRLNNIRRKHKSELKQRAHRKVTRIVLAVITAYFICWVPYWFLQIFITIDPLINSLRLNFSILPVNPSMRFLRELTHLTTIIGYANICLNPVLYVFLSESFREEYLFVLKCFYPTNLFFEPALNAEHTGQNSFEREFQQQTSKQYYRPSEFQMKKIKHSVAIDEISANYRPISSCFPRLSEPKCCSYTSTTLHPIDNSSVYEKPKTKTAVVRLSVCSSHTPRTFLDDGGVYCGE